MVLPEKSEGFLDSFPFAVFLETNGVPWPFLSHTRFLVPIKKKTPTAQARAASKKADSAAPRASEEGDSGGETRRGHETRKETRGVGI